MSTAAPPLAESVIWVVPSLRFMCQGMAAGLEEKRARLSRTC